MSQAHKDAISKGVKSYHACAKSHGCGKGNKATAKPAAKKPAKKAAAKPAAKKVVKKAAKPQGGRVQKAVAKIEGKKAAKPKPKSINFKRDPLVKSPKKIMAGIQSPEIFKDNIKSVKKNKKK